MEVKWVQLICLLVAVGQRSSADLLHSMPGSFSNLSRNDRSLLQVVLRVTWSFNNQSNDIFLFRPSFIHTAQKQIVKGVRYVVDFNISRTVCRKGDNDNLVKCDFQPAGRLQQTLRCHADVWMIPWKHQSEIRELLCGSSPRGQRPPSI